MAQFHLEAIRKTQAGWPIYSNRLFAGWSRNAGSGKKPFLADGERIDLLVLVDSYPYRAYLRFGEKVRLYSRLGARRIKRLLGFQSQESRSRADRTAEAIERMQNQGEIEPSQDLAARYELELECAYMALKGYQPRFYNGEIKFLRAGDPNRFPSQCGGCLATPGQTARDENCSWRPFGNSAQKLRITSFRSVQLSCRNEYHNHEVTTLAVGSGLAIMEPVASRLRPG